MSTPNTPEPVSGKRVLIDAPRLWGGGLATAVVAALVASVGVLVCRDLLHIKLVEPPLLRFTNSFPVNYAITAFVLALVATGLAHLLSVITPRPQAFLAGSLLWPRWSRWSCRSPWGEVSRARSARQRSI
jgi:hypothetical protein